MIGGLLQHRPGRGPKDHASAGVEVDPACRRSEEIGRDAEAFDLRHERIDERGAGDTESRRRGERLEKRLGRQRTRIRLGMLDRMIKPGQPPSGLARQLTRERAEQLSGELATRRDPWHLGEEDRSVRRRGEARCDLGGEQAGEVGRGGVAPEPRGSSVDVVEVAGAQRRDEHAGGFFERVQRQVARRRDRGTEVLVGLGDRGDLASCLSARSGGDVGEERGAGRQLERGMEHERVRRIDPRVPNDLGGGRDELDVGEVVPSRCHRTTVQVEVHFKSREFLSTIGGWSTIC